MAKPTKLKEGQPTEPKRGGLTARDLNEKGAFPAVKPAKAGNQPSITGNDGVPTEPERGGLNKLERKLEGVKAKKQ